MQPPPFVVTVLALLTSVVAQVPVDAAIVLETSAPSQLNYRLVDVFGRGSTPVLGQNVFLTPPPVSVAADPMVPDQFFFMSVVGFPGVFRNTVGLLGRINSSQWGSWLRVIGDRVEVGDSRVVTLRAGIVEAFIKPPNGQPGVPIPLFTLPGAIDLAVAEPLLYVASSSGAVVEFQLVTGAQRTVGSYGSVRAIAVSPFGNELCLGLASGDLQRIEPLTGNLIATQSTGLGPLVAVGYTRIGTLVWADSQQLWSELVPNAPLWISSSSIRDFGVSTALVATATPFGVGCGVGAAATWSVPGRPALGAANFAFGLRNGPALALALLAVGLDRSVSSVLSVALPFDLAPVGAPGCNLLVDPVVIVGGVTDLFGERDQPLPIPNNPALAGIEVSAQWFVADATIGGLGLAATAGLAAAIR